MFPILYDCVFYNNKHYVLTPEGYLFEWKFYNYQCVTVGCNATAKSEWPHLKISGTHTCNKIGADVSNLEKDDKDERLWANPQKQKALSVRKERHIAQKPSKKLEKEKSFHATPLPFYDNFKTILNGRFSSSSPEQNYLIDFEICASDLELISYAKDSPLPRKEIILRMFMVQEEKCLYDKFPDYCNIYIDGTKVEIPKLNRNGEHIPIDITSMLDKSSKGKHKFEAYWDNDGKDYFIMIRMDTRITSTTLLNRLLSQKKIHIYVNDTKKKIAEGSKKEEDEVQVDKFKISLLCPLAKTRIVIPARAKTCTHVQCFDLLNYLKINELAPNWNCPICNGRAYYKHLVIDKYITEILKKVSKEVEEVEFEKNGKWTLVQTKLDNSLKVHKTPSKDLANIDAYVGPCSSLKLGPDPQVILIEDSDEDDAPCSSKRKFSPSISRTFSKKSNLISYFTVLPMQYVTNDSQEAELEYNINNSNLTGSSKTVNEVITISSSEDEEMD